MIVSIEQIDQIQKEIQWVHPLLKNSVALLLMVTKSALAPHRQIRAVPRILDLVHTMPDKFENATLRAKTEQMFCVHTWNRISFDYLYQSLSNIFFKIHLNRDYRSEQRHVLVTWSLTSQVARITG